MPLYYRAWRNTYPVLLGKSLVFFEIHSPFTAQLGKLGILRDPVGQVIFRENNKLSALRSCLGDELGCFGKIELRLQGLLVRDVRVTGSDGGDVGGGGGACFGMELDHGYFVLGSHYKL